MITLMELLVDSNVYGRTSTLTFQFANIPQIEDYHIIDRDDSHLLILWCHGMPDLNLNGALIMSRHSDNDHLPEETLVRFKQAIKDHGYDPEESCDIEQTNCP